MIRVLLYGLGPIGAMMAHPTGSWKGDAVNTTVTLAIPTRPISHASTNARR